jgi:hypothetical protein
VTTPLPDRLRDLADEAPAPLTAGDLWRDGRRRHRRRVAGVLAALGCVAALTTSLGVGGWRSTQPDPAAPPPTDSGPMGIPAQVFDPSPWLPSSRAPGRLVALSSSNRDHFPFGSEGNAVVGVAAGSQTYAFIDLPGQSPDATDVYLSPDGRRLAYWINGAPMGASRVGDNSLLSVAVLDLMTGKVERHVFNTQHGLASASLTWVDDETLAMTASRFSSAIPTSFTEPSRSYLLTVGNPSSYQRLPGDVRDDIPVTSTSGYAVMANPHVLRTWRNGVATELRLSRSVRSLVYDARYGVAAVNRNPDANGLTARKLVVGRVSDGKVRLTAVPQSRRYTDVLTWVDADHVATLRQTRDGTVFDVVDIRTGDRKPLSRKPWYAFQVARDALQQETVVPAIAPPRPWNPRWVALGVLAPFVVLGVTLLVRRRRAAV